MERVRPFDPSVLMQKAWHTLKSDFCSTEGESDAFTVMEMSLRKSVPEFRDLCFDPYFRAPSHYFKRRYQLESWFKRFRFEDDTYSDKELMDKANSDFLSGQLMVHPALERSERIHRVVTTARATIRRILGEYDPDVTASLVKFGKRASVGVPFTKSSLDEKIASGPLTGSSDHIKWFKSYLTTDDNLRLSIIEAHAKMSKRAKVLTTEIDGDIHYRCVESLTLTNVPKTFKSLRSIMPNTTLGAFYTYALGRYVQRQLKEDGLNITKLSDLHKIWAQRYSVTRSHATVDLRRASDSFFSALINALCPRKWYNAFKLGRLSSVEVDGEMSYLSSFMAMGIGYTFPLQTLCFYALLKAVQSLSKCKGRISVFGDDLIYPSEMHKYAVPILNELGFAVNAEKSFVTEEFRESCGGDYHRGCDVRPAMPEGVGGQISPRRYVLFCYKTLNLLLRRWDQTEIPITFQFICSEILRVDCELLQVPPDYPDYSGLKVLGSSEWFMPWAPLTYCRKTYSWSFRYYRLSPKQRPVKFQRVYLWDSLRSTSQGEDPPDLWKFWDIDPASWRKPTREIFSWSTIKWKWVRLVDGTKVRALQPRAIDKSASEEIQVGRGYINR